MLNNATIDKLITMRLKVMADAYIVQEQDPSYRDMDFSERLAMLVDEEVQAADIEKVISKNGGKYFQGVTLFDVYTGKQVAEGCKSVAFNLTFQAEDRTLTDGEIDPIIKNLVAKVAEAYEAQLRK